MTTEDKEKAEILYAFFTSVFNSQTSYPWGTQPPDLKVWDGEQNKPTTNQVDTVRDLLLHLDCHKSVGPEGVRPRVLRELADMIAEMLSIIYQQSCFMQVYEAGVLKALQELSPEILKSASKIYGASSGSILAALVLCECDMVTNNCFVLALDELQKLLISGDIYCVKGLLSSRGKILHVLKDVLNKFLPVNAHQLVSGKLHVILTRVHDWRSVTVSEFATKEDLIQALLCSCFVPLCFGFLPPLYHGVVCDQFYADGYRDTVTFLKNLSLFGINYLAEDFKQLDKELCQKGEGTLHRKPEARILHSRATDPEDITKEKILSIQTAQEIDGEDPNHPLQPSERLNEVKTSGKGEIPLSGY
ncbi:1-acylglycerol-3-phosphate O-acyltransferase PNPLA3-like [Anas acuta]|uniref:1-acylglycerol-3-phosphate O-acyltransferase PNPLA3-like n=1 Tax=Anas acuta TaxID=28680 RepID=UPI0035C8D1FE